MRFRVVLPITLGSIAVELMVWDLQNQRVIESMGMAWDTGAPVWPYQASHLFLSSINAPAYLLAAPFFFLPHVGLVEQRYPVLFPAILLWWWWVGTRIDFGVLGNRHYRRPRLSAFVVIIAGTGFLYVGGQTAFDGVQWWFRYPGSHLLLLNRWTGVALWSFVLAGGCLLAALRLSQRRFPPVAEQRCRSPILVYGFGLTAIVALVTSLIGIVREP